MKKQFLLICISLLLLSGCLLFTNPSADPSGTFINSLSKKDGDWILTELTVSCYINDSALNADAPAFDTLVNNAGTFHFDNSDDIDGEGSFTPTNGQPVTFKYYVPDFDEELTQSPLLRFVFTGFPNMESTADDYHKKDEYTGSGSAAGTASFFPLLPGIPQVEFRQFKFTYRINRKI